MRVFSFYCCCGDFNYKELTLFCIGESVTSIVFLQTKENSIDNIYTDWTKCSYLHNIKYVFVTKRN